MTKKRLADLEESKHGLANEVQSLKDQLNKFESTSQYNMKYEGLNQKPMIKYSIEKEIEELRAELNKTKAHEPSGEALKTIEKYENQKIILSDHNQVQICIIFSKFMS